jgi:hypothetical protein
MVVVPLEPRLALRPRPVVADEDAMRLRGESVSIEQPLMSTWLSALCLVLFAGCTKGTPPAPPSPPPVVPVPKPEPPQPLGTALLDVISDDSATVVAVVKDHKWQAPSVTGAETVKGLARAGAPLEIFAPAGQPKPGAPPRGALSGGVKESCNEFSLALTGSAGARGFAVVSKDVHPRPVEETKPDPAHAAALAALLARVGKVKVAPTIEHAYRVDLDNDGKPEIVLQATHPDLKGDPPKYKRQYYSLIVVLPGQGTGEPAFTGYMQATPDLADFEVLTVDSVADVDGDGRPELLVRARHAEGWQTQVFRYTGRLEEVFRSTAGEGQCPGTPE